MPPSPSTPPPLPSQSSEKKTKRPPKRIVINLSVLTTGIVLGVITLCIAALALASSAFMVESMKSISGATLLCADRMITEVEARHAMESENETLRLRVIELNAKVTLFNELYGLSKENYRESIGGR